MSARSQGYFLVPHGYRWKSALLPAALTHVKILRRMEETGNLLREPKVFKQLALYPYGLWTRMGLYTALKLGQFLYCTFQSVPGPDIFPWKELKYGATNALHVDEVSEVSFWQGLKLKSLACEREYR